MILICSRCLIDAAATSKDQHIPGADCRLSSCPAHLLPTFCKHLTVTEPRRRLVLDRSLSRYVSDSYDW
jgi:hypothetical protein